MRPDLCGLLKLILPHALCKIAQPKVRQQPLLWLMYDYAHLKLILAILRYMSLFYRTRAVDANGYELSQNNMSYQHQFMVIYIFTAPVWSVKICTAVPANAFKHVHPASKFFPGLTWGEREISEMLGINFSGKLDARRLMLDYAFEGHPLRKSFPCMGFEELEYSTLERWVVYNIINYRDEIDF